MSDKNNKPSLVQRFRNSFKGTKGEKRQQIQTRKNEPWQVYLMVSSKDVNANIEKLKDALKKMSKALQREKKASYVDPELHKQVQMCIRNVSKCFKEQGPNINQDIEDDDGGFSQKSSEGRSQISSVTVHNTEPVADYTFNTNGRKQKANERESLPTYTIIGPGRQQEQAYADGTNHQEHNRARGRTREDQTQFKRAHSVEERRPRYNRESKLQDELEVREQANESLQKKIKLLESEIGRYKRDLQTETKARESAQNRLSEMMGKQLKTNNPAITDLSDPDRPLTLVDKFSNVYDNDWTDIIEDIERVLHDERTSIKILLSIVTDTYSECYALRHKGKFFMGFENRSASVKFTATKVPDDCNYLLKSIPGDHLKDLRDALLKNLANEVDRHVLSCVTESSKQYLTKCLELCWMMVCHTPPIHLEWNYKGQPFDQTLLKPYTEAGDIVEYVVWPVVFLHKDGPILSKGVAQGKIRNVQHTQF